MPQKRERERERISLVHSASRRENERISVSTALEAAQNTCKFQLGASVRSIVAKRMI